MNISKFIDYTLQKETITREDVIELCDKAMQNNFYSICVHSAHINLSKQLLRESDVKICAIIGYPFGEASTASKIEEATRALKNGADEIDMVINIEFLKDRNYIAVLKDICDLKLAIGGTLLKVCIEISKLNKNEIIRACEICLDAKVDYIKTSSSFTKNSATLTAVKIIKKTVRDAMKIKASGDINDYQIAIKYLDAGAERIGTSSILKIEDQTRQIKNSKIYKQYLEAKNKANTTPSDTVKSDNLFSN
ncbi:MAG: deoxyribose-phosphate aldolase [Algibacter sp.]